MLLDLGTISKKKQILQAIKTYGSSKLDTLKHTRDDRMIKIERFLNVDKQKYSESVSVSTAKW